jgi:predicted Zn-dependent protease
MVSFIKNHIKIQNNEMILIFTDGDLFPRDGWSFVFGMTEVKSRVCLISTARHDPDFPNNQDVLKMNDDWKIQIMLYRALKTSTHELCHVLYITHCHYYECLMNGSNLLTEADLKPFILCAVCLRKL